MMVADGDKGERGGRVTVAGKDEGEDDGEETP